MMNCRYVLKFYIWGMRVNPRENSLELTISRLFRECFFDTKWHRLIPCCIFELDFNRWLFCAVLELHNEWIWIRFESSSCEIKIRTCCCRVGKNRVFIFLVFGNGRNRTVPFVTSFFTVLPDLLKGHFLLIDFIDNRTRVFHTWHRRLFHTTAITVVKRT